MMLLKKEAPKFCFPYCFRFTFGYLIVRIDLDSYYIVRMYLDSALHKEEINSIFENL